MSQTRVVILNETELKLEDEWTIALQYCRYEYGNNGGEQNGYRFIWKKPNGNLQAARGQTRIPSLSIVLRLISKAIDEGWGSHIHYGGNFEYN